MTESRVWKEIEVPEELDQVITDAVGEGYRRLMQKKKVKRWRTAVISMATAAACFMAVFIGFVNPVVAKAYSSIPVIGNIFAYLYDATDSEIPYAQVLESAVPVKEQDETEQGGLVPEEAAGTEDAVQFSIKEYFCDGYSLYLSFEVVSEEPFVEGAADMAGKDGEIFLYATENITTETGERFKIGSGALKIAGVFRDEHTFVGIARSGNSLDRYSLTDKMQYELEAMHMEVYANDSERDISGEWKASAEITYMNGGLVTEALGETICADMRLKEVRMQPYEIQVVIEEPKGMSTAGEWIYIAVFDDQGRRLSSSTSLSVNRFVEEEETRLEIWMFERPADAEKVTVFAVDELKWMDEWKGYLYCDEPWSGQQMTEFLKENCFAYGEVELQ